MHGTGVQGVHYLAALEEANAENDERKMTKEEIESKLKTLQERKERYADRPKSRFSDGLGGVIR